MFVFRFSNSGCGGTGSFLTPGRLPLVGCCSLKGEPRVLQNTATSAKNSKEAKNPNTWWGKKMVRQQDRKRGADEEVWEGSGQKMML